MRIEILPNGLLSVYDYGPQWQLLFKRDQHGQWQPHNANAQGSAYKKLLKDLNS
jgi:hypothetical protein